MVIDHVFTDLKSNNLNDFTVFASVVQFVVANLVRFRVSIGVINQNVLCRNHYF